jgi:hypothetical protein
MLGPIGSVSTSMASMFSAMSSATGEIASVAAAHPVAAAILSVGSYDLFGGSNNPPHLGQNVDTSA